jgi:hypothetical protein
MFSVVLPLHGASGPERFSHQPPASFCQVACDLRNACQFSPMILPASLLWLMNRISTLVVITGADIA